jgi:site-specific DNA recombinase
MATRCVIYLRQSEDRDGTGTAVERQAADCRRLAEYRGWDVVEVVTENDVSASGRAQRPGFDRVVQHLVSGSAQAVVAERLDRLTRNARDTLRLLEAGEAARAQLVFTQGSDLNLATADGVAMAGVLASFAQGEIRKKGERQREANANRAGRGHASWTRRPFGYDRDEAGGVVVLEDEAAAIKAAARAVLDGGTLAAEVRKIQAAGLTTTAGGPFNVTTLRRILINPRYSGRTTYNGVDVAEGTWPVILDADTQREITERLRNPKRRTQQGTEFKYLLSGSAICGVCEEKMFASTYLSRGNRYMVLKCFAKPHLARRMDRVEELVTAVVLARLQQPDVARLLVPDVDVDALRAEADDLRERRDGVAELVAEKLLPVAAAREQLTKLGARLGEIEDRIAATLSTSPAAQVAMSDDVGATWANLPVRSRRTIVDALLTVTILPVGLGSRWDPEKSLRIDWR